MINKNKKSLKENNIKEITRAILTVITYIAFLGLIVFAIVYNTLKNQLMDRWYWGVIAVLVAGIVISIKWFFGGKKW